MKIIAFTGAGISKQSNIPTFIDRPDVRDKLHRSYAKQHPDEYNAVIKQLKAIISAAQPNDAHYALAEYKVPIITMNIDGLHTAAGSEKVLELHGGLPDDNELDRAYTLYNKPVLYGDPAPNYELAYDCVANLSVGDIFLVVGCSYATAIAGDLRRVAEVTGATTYEIQEDAATNVRFMLQKLFPNGKAA